MPASASFGLADSLALVGGINGHLDLDAAAEADLFLNLRYGTGAEVVRRFRRSALVDIDPGLLQIWMHTGQLGVAPHDVYLTIGETVGTAAARFPDGGVRWQYTPPPVFLPAVASRHGRSRARPTPPSRGGGAATG